LFARELLDVGGKALTNQLKEWISYRQLDVREETYVINGCKEDVCFVSSNFEEDLKKEITKVEYLLPDFVTAFRGEINQSFTTQVADRHKLLLGIERFTIPEILFRPSDIGIDQMGIVEAIYTSLSQFTTEIQYWMTQNIILIGGNSLFLGYKDRIERDLRCLLSDSTDFRVVLPEHPITCPWESAKRILSPEMIDSEFCSKFVTRQEYIEHGSRICRKKFSNFH